MLDLDHTTFAAALGAAGEALDPVYANLLFAREIAYPALRPSEYLFQLDGLRAAAAPAVAAAPTQPAQALADFLFGAGGFQGNRADYGDPRNSYLNDVLARRLGLPISLSVLYTHLARALGLPAQDIGLPGHFIVAVGEGAAVQYLDPFNGGARLSRADCAQLVTRATGYTGRFDPRWLAPTPPRAIVARMLNNLRNTYTEAEDWPLTIRVIERLRELEPDQSGHVRDLGMVYYKDGAYNRAAQLFHEYLTLAPDAADAGTVRQSRDLLLDELARLN